MNESPEDRAARKRLARQQQRALERELRPPRRLAVPGRRPQLSLSASAWVDGVKPTETPKEGR